MAMKAGLILVTGFEPFGPYAVNPSGELAKAVDGRQVGGSDIHGAVLPVHHAHTRGRILALLAELRPIAVLNLGLAAGRARIGLERIAVNVLDYPMPDNSGRTMIDEPCVPGGPAAYVSTLPIRTILVALRREGIPATVSDSAGTYLCNQTMYATLHALAERNVAVRAGLMHLPLLPVMVAASDLDQPSMDFGLMLRAVEVALEVLASPIASSGWA
jgi:pyroglutamyl-peptidase